VQLQNDIAEIKLRAERKAGTLLADMGPQHGGDRKSKSRCQQVTLKDLGINKKQCERWQAEASIPERFFERHITAVRSTAKELTSAGLLLLAKERAKAAWIRKRQRDSQAFAARLKVPGDQGILCGDRGLLGDRLKDEP
jgi:hypothetical protein